MDEDIFCPSSLWQLLANWQTARGQNITNELDGTIWLQSQFTASACLGSKINEDGNAFAKVPSDIPSSMLGPLSSKENDGPNQGGMFTTTPPLANEHVQAAVASFSASAVVLTPGVPTTTATTTSTSMARSISSDQPPVATFASAAIAHGLASEPAAVSIPPSDRAMMLSAETEQTAAIAVD